MQKIDITDSMKKAGQTIVQTFTPQKVKEAQAEQAELNAEITRLQTIVEKQRAFFSSGETRNIKWRKTQLKKLYDSIKQNETQIAQALRDDLFKSPFESYATETGLVLSEIQNQIKHLSSWSREGKTPIDLASFPGRTHIITEPYGVSLIMSPWNYPFMLSIEPLVNALAAGNTAVLKPSRYSAKTSAIMEKILTETFPPEYVSVIQGGHLQNTALLSCHFDFIFFTGSEKVGKIVMESAAKFLTPICLELGGKSPVIITESANIKLTARRLVWGKFLNAGQTCVAPDYVLVDNKQKGILLASLNEEIKKQFGNDPLTDNDFPKIINEKHFKRLANLAPQARKNEVSNKIAPTVIDLGELGSLEAKENPLMKEEIFGPLLPVISYHSLSDVIPYINEKKTPLALYIFSTNKKETRKLLSSIQSGGGCVNDVVLHLTGSSSPFGGLGESGMGCYHGKFGFDTFSHKRSILMQSPFVDIPLRYAPYKDKLKLLKLFLK